MKPCAILFFGLLPRWEHDAQRSMTKRDGLAQFRAAFVTVRRHVQDTAPAPVHLFGHTWSDQYRATRVVPSDFDEHGFRKVVTTKQPKQPLVRSVYAALSLELGLAAIDASYRWVFMARWDLVMMTDFPWPLCVDGRFYISQSCRGQQKSADGCARFLPMARQPVPVDTHDPALLEAHMARIDAVNATDVVDAMKKCWEPFYVGDFWFLASPADAKRAFRDTVRRLRPRFVHMCNGHSAMAYLIFSTQTAIGRVLTHGQEYTFLRGRIVVVANGTVTTPRRHMRLNLPTSPYAPSSGSQYFSRCEQTFCPAAFPDAADLTTYAR